MYNFVLLNNLVELEVSSYCGDVITGLTGFLLLINMLVIAYVSFMEIRHKLRIRKLKKKALALQEQRNIALKSMQNIPINLPKQKAESSSDSSISSEEEDSSDSSPQDKSVPYDGPEA
mmetsp:Transcript_27028/g.36119  ORF Transcript_27028/g.36119 Transcript_27028/m.36119 type:complete len:118 (+) Transcript_27028:1124-1477(+)